MEVCTAFEEENRTYWTKRAPSYSWVNQDELQTSQHDVWSHVLTARIDAFYPDKQRQDIHVLDIGTGPGFFAILLAEQGYAVTAVDYTESMLQEAKRNANALQDRIVFQRMNAEKLSFVADSFDVIVTRNVTWNLPHPQTAYQEWQRVLKPGGLLLNFDANWYRYLYDETARQGYIADRKEIQRSGVSNETDGTDIPAMEAIARQVPLSLAVRPQWDTDVLTALGMEVTADTEIWQTVWTRTERINNASTPMFCIQAVKAAR